MKLRGWQSPAGLNSLYCLPGRDGFSCFLVYLFYLPIYLVKGLGLRPEWTPEKPREGRGWPVQPASLLTSGSYSKRRRGLANLTPICILHTSLQGSWLAKGHLLWILEGSLGGSKTRSHKAGRESGQAGRGMEGGSPQSSGQKRCRPAHLRLAPELGIDSTLFLIVPQ